jgi:hypothetical protein
MRLLFLIAIIVSFAACSEKNLEIVPRDRLSDATVWNDAKTANLFLNDIYNNLNAGPFVTTFTNQPSEISNDPLDNFTDNTCYGPVAGITSAKLFDPGSYGPSESLFHPMWGNMYDRIRKCNLFLEKVADAPFDEADKKVMIAQARFLRAYFYKMLIDLYGGVPLITKVLNNNVDGDDIFYPRNSYEECIAFLQTECEAAYADLPLKWTGKDVGRATKGAALALKGEAELYAGKWEQAAATNKKIIDEMGNGIVYDLFPDYAGLFYANNENNEEVIFDIQFAPNIKTKRINQYWGVVELPKGGGWGAACPTHDLVEEYEFIDGKTAAEGSAYYDPAKPYENREKRFYASIIYDGSIWRGAPVYTRLGIPNNNNEIRQGGNGGRTGYFIKKLQDSTIGSTAAQAELDGTNVIVWRYAEVLLNYAEAQNEAFGPDQSVYDAVNSVRARAGQPALPTGLSKEEMRQKIRHERRIEFAFEGKRFYDIMRWRIAEEIFSKPIHGMEIKEENGQLVYNKIVIRNVHFDPSKHYLQPIPQVAIDRNSKLVQNPNYN